ncbi:MAG TPA: zinc ribbon domain-containing protein [Candidatus Thermoplasmatota archaeon]|nr:zinc ribbon domain-containing protein [Candidatus Thermoplasmatota archaeon]
MTDHCSDCGAELIEGSKFCTVCGKTVEQQQVTPVQSQPQQQEEHHQGSVVPTKKQKPRKKLVIGLLAIAAVVIIILIIIVYLQSGTNFLGNGNADSRFIGEWEDNTFGSPYQWKFNSDSTLEKGLSADSMNDTGTWNVTGNQLCLYDNAVCYTYVISNDGTVVTLKRIGDSVIYPANLILTKKGQQGTNRTPAIDCTVDSSINRIIIESIDANVRWSDIKITTTPATANWQVQDGSQKGLARIGITDTITTFVTVGDNIFVLDPVGDVSVTLTYLPTNAILGNWTVNI